MFDFKDFEKRVKIVTKALFLEFDGVQNELRFEDLF